MAEELITWIKTTSAPASASAIAMAWPMPRVPPVTTALRPSSEKRDCRALAMMLVLRACVSVGLEDICFEERLQLCAKDAQICFP
jgi:hypothetical protein